MTAGVSNSGGDCIAPVSLTLPSIPAASQTAQAPAGLIGISGATLEIFDGSNWKSVTAA